MSGGPAAFAPLALQRASPKLAWGRASEGGKVRTTQERFLRGFYFTRYTLTSVFVKTAVKYSGCASNFETAGYAARSVPSTYR